MGGHTHSEHPNSSAIMHQMSECAGTGGSLQLNPLPWGEAHIYYFLWIFICHDILFGQAAAKFYFALPRANDGQKAQCGGVSSDRRAAAVFGDGLLSRMEHGCCS